MQSCTRMGTGKSKTVCPIIVVAMSVQFYFQFLFYRKICHTIKVHTNKLSNFIHNDIPVCECNERNKHPQGKKSADFMSYSTPKESCCPVPPKRRRNCQHCDKFKPVVLGIKCLDQRLRLSDISAVLCKNLLGPYTSKIWNIMY